MKKLTNFCIFLITIISNIVLCHTLECYVCNDQETNKDKCVRTVRTCGPEHDTCQTQVLWGSSPYWDQAARKQYYISKNCTTWTDCERLRAKYVHDCTYLWYVDWKCIDCCKGDKCNHYIMSDVSKIQSNPKLAILSVLALLFFTTRFYNN